MSEHKENADQSLQRKLSPRLVTMIAMGGTIGTGLFVASGQAVNMAGPGGVLVAYIIVAFMVFLIMAGLTEMATHNPVSGSFETYAAEYVDPALGFSLGWNYWFSWAITLGSEVIACGILMKYWFPHTPSLVWNVLFIAILLILNLPSVKVFGEAEFYFAGIKVVTVIIFIFVGFLMIIGILGGEHGGTGLRNFVDYGGPFPHGFLGILQMTFIAAWSFQGTELLGIMAGESDNPQKTIPRANRALIFRLVVFYILAIFVVSALIPWEEAGLNESIFTTVFSRSGIPYAGDIMNFVMITAILSCGNSATYASSRLMHSMAQAGRAPKLFSKLSKGGVPIYAVLITVAFGCVSFLTAIFSESTVYMWIISLGGLTGLLTWLSISFSHLRFRKIYAAKHKGDLSGLKYKAPLYPISTLLALVLCLTVTIGNAIDPDSRMSLYLGLPAFFGMWAVYKIKNKTKFVRVPKQ